MSWADPISGDDDRSEFYRRLQEAWLEAVWLSCQPLLRDAIEVEASCD